MTGKWLYKQGKRIKFIQLMVPIPDAALYERFMAQFCAGDMVQLTVTTEWSDTGYSAYLADFVHVSQAASEAIEPMSEPAAALVR